MRKLILLCVTIPATLSAQVTFDPVINLSNTPGATSSYHSVYSYTEIPIKDGPNYGYYFLVWGDNEQVMFKKSVWGQQWTQNKVIAPAGAYPVVTADLNRIAVLYHNLNSGVYSVYSTTEGVTWSAPALISLTSTGQTPQITFEQYYNNYIYAAWEERPGSNYEIYFSRSSDFGATWSPPQNISNSPTTSRWVQVKSFGNIIYCAWIETSSYPFSDIYFTKSTDAGNTWQTPVNITNDTRPQNRIYMFVQNNHIYIACDDITSYPVYNYDDIYLIKSVDGGITWSPSVNITNNPGHSSTPFIAVVEPYVYFTWADNTDSAPLYDNSDIYFKMSTDFGATWQDSVRICSNPDFSSRPQICWAFAGPYPGPWIDLAVIWYDYSTGDAEILARNGTHVFIPVEMISFSVQTAGNTVRLKWSTATETNNKGFGIERKRYSGDWQNVGFVAGNNTTIERRDYFYEDKNVPSGKYHYRLKQIDFDGTFKYSDEIETEIFNPETFILKQNYPNPFNNSSVIEYSVPRQSRVTMKIFSSLGEEIKVILNEEKAAGSYSINLDASEFPSGTYFYTLQAGDFFRTMKMILMK